MENCYHPTKPLPVAHEYNNKIYDFSPEQIVCEEVDTRLLKRCKSVKSPELRFDTPTPSMSSAMIGRTLNSRRPRRRRPLVKLSSCEFQNKYELNGFSSDSEFSFTSNSDSDLDLESLPDLVDDEQTPLCSPHPLTPKTHFLERAGSLFSDYQPRKLKFVEHKPSIFDIPEIVYKIVEFAAIQNDSSPKEVTPVRRKPLSYNHALLIHGNKDVAKDSMEIVEEPSEVSSNVLYNCSLVNKLFNSVSSEILRQRFYFEDEARLHSFLHNTPATTPCKPQEFKLYKMFNLTNEILDPALEGFQFQNLHTIEIFMCPRFLPSQKMFEHGHKIKNIMICGSKLVDDDYLRMISEKCPNLEVLDIRGCEYVTDSGIYHIGKRCRKLTSVNFGRKNKGHLVTDLGLSKLIENNNNLITLGLAGCHITDRILWDLTSHCNYTLQRLLVNNCPLITNQSIPLILHAKFLPSLNVLEFRFTHIDNLKPIIEFKRQLEFQGTPVLIEMCESLSLKMRKQELELDRVISQRIFNDIQDWANDLNDGDSCYLTLLRSRSSLR